MQINVLDEKEIEKSPYSRLIVSKKTSYHMHTFFEINICINGYYDNYINGVHYKIESGQIILLRPQDKHYLSSSVSYVARDIYITTQDFRAICDCIDDNLYDILSSNELSLDFHISDFDLQTLESKLNYFNYTEAKNPLSLKIAHRSIILQILDLWQQSRSKKNTIFPEWLSLLISQINTEKFLTKNINDISEATHYSHGHLCREFKKYMGITLQEYLTDIKFSYATAMLQDKDISIPKIAEKLNYGSPSNFTVAFKNRFGISPSAWRKQHFE